MSSLGLPDGDVGEFLALAAAHGCRSIELRTAAGQPVSTCLDDAARAELRKRLAGFEVLALASYQRICADEPDELPAHLRLAADVGAAGVRVFPGGDGTEEAHRRGIARVAAAADLAARLGVRILLETHDTHPRGADVARLLDSPDLAGAPVGAIWDVAHPWVAGEEPAATWDALSPYLSHVQVKDVEERRPGATPTFPGEGALPLDDVLRVLADGGYGGPLVLEWEKPWHPQIPGLGVALRVTSRWLSR